MPSEAPGKVQQYIATTAIRITSIGISILLEFSIPFSTPIAITRIVTPKNNKNQIIGSTGDVINCSNKVKPKAFVAATSLFYQLEFLQP